MEQKSRSAWWSITINNPTAADDECVAQARQKGWTVKGQKEKGKNGTEHYQIALHTGQQRFASVKKVFPRAHIEPARNPSALVEYVGKEETRTGDLPKTDLYCPLSKVWETMYHRWYHEDEDYMETMYHRQKTKLSFREWSGQRLLRNFDETIRYMIRQKYMVEMIAVNPQVRSAAKNYGFEIMARTKETIYRINASSESRSSPSECSSPSQSAEDDDFSSGSSSAGSVL